MLDKSYPYQLTKWLREIKLRSIITQLQKYKGKQGKDFIVQSKIFGTGKHAHVLWAIFTPGKKMNKNADWSRQGRLLSLRAYKKLTDKERQALRSINMD